MSYSGIHRYTFAFNLWTKLAKIPVPIRRLLGLAISSISLHLNAMIKPFNIIPNKFRLNNLDNYKGVRVLKSGSLDQLYSALTSHWEDPSSIVIDGFEPKHETFMGTFLESFNDIERMMLLDMMTYLPYDILVKIDRAAMGVSLETRVPFLDYRLVQFALSLPKKWKIREGKGKWILQITFKVSTRESDRKTKNGFWCTNRLLARGELKEWAQDLMNPTKLKNQGFIMSDPIQKNFLSISVAKETGNINSGRY